MTITIAADIATSESYSGLSILSAVALCFGIERRAATKRGAIGTKRSISSSLQTLQAKILTSAIYAVIQRGLVRSREKR